VAVGSAAGEWLRLIMTNEGGFMTMTLLGYTLCESVKNEIEVEEIKQEQGILLTR